MSIALKSADECEDNISQLSFESGGVIFEVGIEYKCNYTSIANAYVVNFIVVYKCGQGHIFLMMHYCLDSHFFQVNKSNKCIDVLKINHTVQTQSKTIQHITKPEFY
jgi:hypothetical protein